MPQLANWFQDWKGIQRYKLSVDRWLTPVELDRNISILFKDLRWNNVGLVGGRAFLTLCQTNKTLSDVNLIGNNVPDEIMQSIGESTWDFFVMNFLFEPCYSCFHFKVMLWQKTENNEQRTLSTLKIFRFCREKWKMHMKKKLWKSIRRWLEWLCRNNQCWNRTGWI